MFYQKGFANLPTTNLPTWILLILIIITFNFNIALANNIVDIDESVIKDTSELTDHDSVIFTGTTTGTLNHNLTEETLFNIVNIKTNYNGVGIIDIDGGTTLNITNIGDSYKMIDRVLFHSSAILSSLLDIFNHHCFIKAVFFYSLGYSF
jgi:hypothetical protein